MTENEAIAHARKVAEDKRADADWRWRHGRLNSDDCTKCAEEHEQLADWLEELRQYRAIGTAEECREAREKQMAKKPILDTIYHQQYYCPNCEDFLARKNGNKPYHCICGQAIDWSNLE